MGRTDTSQSRQKLQILEALQKVPEARQADLAVQVGVSVGTVNWHLKRLTAKGLIKVKQIGRWRWQYLLTPQGMAEKAQLTAAYVQNSMTLYRKTRHQALHLLQKVQSAGFEQVRLSGEGELLEICRLTCLEQKMKIASERIENVPLLRQVGLQLQLEWPERFNALVKQR